MMKTLFGALLAGTLMTGAVDAQLVSVQQEIYGMD